MKRTYFSVLASTFLFSSMEISLKIAGAAFNAIQLNLLRFFIGGLVLVPLALHDLHKQHGSCISRTGDYSPSRGLCA